MGKETDLSRLQSLYKNFREGSYIIKQNEKSKGLYILLSGRLSVYRDEVKVGSIYKRGDYIGDIAVLLNTFCSASVKSDTDSTLIFIEYERVNNFLRHDPEIAIALARKMAERLAELNSGFAALIDRSYRPDLVKDLKEKNASPTAVNPEEELNLESLKSLYTEITDGIYILEQNKMPSALYILVKGTVEIVKNEKIIAVESKPGYYLGDVSILRNTTSNASVRARGKCTLIEIPRGKVDAFLSHSPEIAISISRKLAERTLSINDLFLDLQKHAVGELSDLKKREMKDFEREIYSYLGIDPNSFNK